MEEGEGIRLMLRVFVNDKELLAASIALELSNREPSSFQFALPEPSDVNLGDSVKIYRDGHHVFTGLIEQILKRRDLNGLEVVVGGRDLSARLATRVLEDGLLEGEPRDLLKSALRPSRKLWQAHRRVNFAHEGYSDWRCGDGSFGDLARWALESDYYACYLYGEIPDGHPGTGFTNQYNATESDPISDIYAGMLFTFDHANVPKPSNNESPGLGTKAYTLWPGLFLRYVDDLNWVGANMYFSAWRYKPPNVSVWYYVIETGVEARWCVNGTITSVRSGVEHDEGYLYICPDYEIIPWDAIRYKRKGHHFLLFARAIGSQIFAWLEDLDDPRVWAVGETLPSTAPGSGATGITIQFNAPNGLKYTNVIKFYRLFTAPASPLCSASSNGDLAGAAGLASEEIPWRSASSQTQGDWFMLDLGEAKEICRVRILQDEVNFARHWRLERSLNGSDWTTIASASNYQYPMIDVPFDPASARYIRIVITYAIDKPWHIHTFWVYQPDGEVLASFDDSSLDVYGDRISVRADGASALELAQRVAEICGWNFWIDKDGRAWFKARRGADKSSTVKFGYAERPILSVSRSLDYRRATNELYFEGHGKTPPDQRRLFVTARDADSQSAHGTLFRRRSGKDLVRIGSVARRAQKELEEESTLAEEFSE